jgi:hypothetical protein
MTGRSLVRALRQTEWRDTMTQRELLQVNCPVDQEE